MNESHTALPARSPYRIRLAVAALLALPLAPVSADQAQFTFTVPISLRELHPDVELARVTCSVKTRSNAVIGHGRSRPIRVHGSYTGTVTVNVNASRGMDPNDAVKYSCSLALTVKDVGTQPVDVMARRGSPYYTPYAEHQPGTSYTPIVRGTIPRHALKAPIPKRSVPVPRRNFLSR